MIDAQRKGLLSIGACMCATAVALTPLAGRSSFDAGVVHAASASRVTVAAAAQSTPAPPVVVVRDPFLNETQDVSAAQKPVGAAGAPSHGFPVVRAVISGTQPRALVDQDGSIRIVAIGDRIAGARIEAIFARSIRLANGVTLELKDNVR